MQAFFQIIRLLPFYGSVQRLLVLGGECAGDKLKIVKLNTDEEGAIAMKYGISSIPTMNVFVNGEVVKTIVGAKPKPALLKDLESYIK